MLKSFLHRDRQPHRALILSFGCSGSVWLSQTLHKLPHVFCTVGTDHPIESINYWHNKAEYLHLLDLVKQGYFAEYGCNTILSKEYGLELPRRRNDFTNVIFDEALELSYHLCPDREYIINVHGLNVNTYLDSSYRMQDNLKIYDLIRHPIPTAQACLNAYTFTWRYSEECKKPFIKILQDNLLFLAKCSRDYKIDFSNPINALSFCAFKFVEAITHSLSRLNCPRLQFERLRTEPDYFINFYLMLFDSKPSEEYLQFVYSSENLASGRIFPPDINKAPLQPKEQYEAWTDEQRILFKAMFNHDLEKIYLDYNYDFSFIK